MKNSITNHKNVFSLTTILLSWAFNQDWSVPYAYINFGLSIAGYNMAALVSICFLNESLKSPGFAIYFWNIFAPNTL